MSGILEACDEPLWAAVLREKGKRIQNGDEEDFQTAFCELLHLLGGAGSLSDLVLYREGRADPGINGRFDSLRTELGRTLLELIGT